MLLRFIAGSDGLVGTAYKEQSQQSKIAFLCSVCL